MKSPTHLIFGTTGGMGRALCDRLSRRGASPLIGGRDFVRLAELSRRIGAEPLTERLTRTPASLAASETMHPMGRIGEPEDVAAAIEWLLEPGNTWVSGQVIGVDGRIATLRGKARA